LKPLVFSWRARQTWRRGTGNAAARRQRAPPPSQNSLAALQEWRNCPQSRHHVRQERRCRVSSQRWSAGVTPQPLIARTNRQRLLLPPGKRSRIVSLFCMSHAIAAHAVIKLLVLFYLHIKRHFHNSFRNHYSYRVFTPSIKHIHNPRLMPLTNNPYGNHQCGTFAKWLSSTTQNAKLLFT
jgi:hypothetical protein